VVSRRLRLGLEDRNVSSSICENLPRRAPIFARAVSIVRSCQKPRSLVDLDIRDHVERTAARGRDGASADERLRNDAAEAPYRTGLSRWSFP